MSKIFGFRILLTRENQGEEAGEEGGKRRPPFFALEFCNSLEFNGGDANLLFGNG